MKNIERRKFKRFPVLYRLAKPVLLRLDGEKTGKTEEVIPAIMSDLSAGGMAILTFLPLAISPLGKTLIITFDLTVIQGNHVKGRVVRCENKDGLYILGIEFLNLPDDIFDKINLMADDFDSCETRILLGEKPICRKGCRYSEHCQRRVKGHYE
ncbi:MAG: PilZ domain-containing protein [Elusimicrobiota bacterium]